MLSMCFCQQPTTSRVRMDLASASSINTRVLMTPGSLRVVVINDQRWVVRAVLRIRPGSDPHAPTLRFFNGAETRYAGEYPDDWPALPESELTSIFQRAEPTPALGR
jgi:hypothetical protein